jgi:hypothetical protein
MSNLFRLFLTTYLFLFLSSCKKSHEVHFHGNVTYKCNGLPASGIKIQIYEAEESASDHSSGVVGEGTTDTDGNYSFIVSVTNEGSNSGYGIQQAPPYGQGHGVFEANNNPGSQDGNSDVQLNGIATTAGNIICHIINSNPYDNNDSFSLDFAWHVTSTSGSFKNIISNLKGTNVDTIITLIGTSDYNNVIKYYSTKNSNYVENKDTVVAGCLADKNIDIFY